ncbi:hypothetical protein [Merismopedia glauca]|nr:hypothetical protein [Merismopedia glauca]
MLSIYGGLLAIALRYKILRVIAIASLFPFFNINLVIHPWL